MKAPEKNEVTREDFLQEGTWEILKVRKVNEGFYSFDLKIFGLTVYNMGLKWYEKGKKWFIAMPSRKGKDKNGADAYFNVVYIPLSDGDQDQLMKAVEVLID